MIKAVLIDLDNTLLETQALYNAAEADLQHLIEARSGARASDVADEIQRRKLVLFDQYGYDPAMLPRAYEEALIAFVPTASDDDILHAHQLGYRIFEEEARLKEGVEESIRLLADHFLLYLVTVGDEAVQRRRIETLPFRDLFTELFIVPDKNADTYRAVLRHCQCTPDEAVMIGDSLKSDIIPAVEAGLTAIHIPGSNWHGREMQGLTAPRNGVTTHSHLRDAVDFLIAPETREPWHAPLKAPLPRRRPGPGF
jgi:putative hydrolase of the HAD superfamily